MTFSDKIPKPQIYTNQLSFLDLWLMETYAFLSGLHTTKADMMVFKQR